MAGKGMPTIGSKRSSSFAGKSKVISSGKLTPVRGGKGHMFGRQSVKTAKAR